MKKFLIGVLAVVVLLAAAIGIFVMTFDANRFKPFFVSTLESSLGKPVSVGDLRLRWHNGLAIAAQDIVFYEDKAKHISAGLKVSSISAQIKFFPLLRKSFELVSLNIDSPSVQIVRTNEGKILVGGMDFSKNNKSGPEKKSSATTLQPANTFLLSVESIRLKKGHLIVEDRLPAKPVRLEVRDLDVKISQFSLNQPFLVEISANVFGDRPNLYVKTRVKLAQAGELIVLSEADLKVDLSEIDLQQVADVYPQVAVLDLKERLSGKLLAQFEQFSFGDKDFVTQKGSIELRDGRIPVAGLEKPVSNVQAKAVVSGSEIEIENLQAQMLGGQLILRGKAVGYQREPLFYLNGTIKNISLGELVKNLKPGAPQIQGHLSFDFEGDAKSFAWEGISHTLNGRARMVMNDGVILNYNLLREIIEKISIIPGVEEAIRNNLPKIYQMKMQETSTLLKPLDLQGSIRNGVLHLDPMVLATDYVTIHGVGDFGLDRHIAARGNVLLNSELSQTLVALFNTVQLLANDRGEIVIPVTVQGDLPQVKIMPDKDYIVSKILSGTTTETLQGFVTDPKKTLDGFKDIFKKAGQSVNL